MLMLGLATLLFFPLLDGGTAFGQGLVGAVAPVGLSVAVGAGLFGIGMQLAGGCASGTLYTVGGGSTKMVFTLARSEEHTSELQSLMRISYAVFCLKKKNTTIKHSPTHSRS